MNGLSAKTALVTGATSGIGRASALTLAARGARVLVHYRSADADAVVAEIDRNGGRADAVYADLASRTARTSWQRGFAR